jgi:hypothetical protein
MHRRCVAGQGGFPRVQCVEKEPLTPTLSPRAGRGSIPTVKLWPHHVAVPFMVGCPTEFAVHVSMPPSVSLALTENSLPSNKGCTPR